MLPLVHTEKSYWPEELAHQRMETEAQGSNLLIQQMQNQQWSEGVSHGLFFIYTTENVNDSTREQESIFHFTESLTFV